MYLTIRKEDEKVYVNNNEAFTETILKNDPKSMVKRITLVCTFYKQR